VKAPLFFFFFFAEMLKELMANIMNTYMLRREINVEQNKILR